jgi:hypothetical protein
LLVDQVTRYDPSMGAWDSGPFDNDDAADWLIETAGAEAPARTKLEEALALGKAGGRLGTRLACEAVAAMALVAMAWDDTLRERWSLQLGSEGLDIAATLAASRALRRVAADCVPLLAASELMELWGADEEWWEALQMIATSVGYSRVDRSTSLGSASKGASHGIELVTRLGLRQYVVGHYLTIDSGDIVRVPAGTPAWQRDDLAEVVSRGAFRPDEDYDHWIDDHGDLVRRKIDPRLRAHLFVRFRAPSSEVFDETDLGFERAGLVSLEELLAEVDAGTDLEDLVRRARVRALDRERPSIKDVCTLADWKSWRAQGALKHRALLTQRIRALMMAIRDELDGS